VRQNNLNPTEKAHSYAFLLLKFRLRSEKELYQRLKRKNFSPQVIEETLSFLKEKGFIDDRVFAKAWAESRIKKPFGPRRIEQELNLKGVDKKIIKDRLQKLKKSYSEEALIKKIARERIEKLKRVDPDAARRRLYAYLLRRGFSPDIVSEVVSQL